MTSPTATGPAGGGASSQRGLALYRKYRSATFAELIGQEHVTRPLSTALDHGRINHAYLFSGPRGCGKTSSARILARSLNCAQGPTSTPCGVCDSCVELAPNGPGSIDVIEIDAASHNGVDDARDLRERAWYAPVRDRFKVYIVDEAHMVTTAAFNALLKLVEEPPDFLVFVFATTEPDKVLQTIRSRTHHYPFRLVAPSVLRAHLASICAREGVTVQAPVLPLVTRAGGGSVRDSLSILDQLLAGSGDDGLRYADAVGLLGVTDAALIDTVVDALAAADAAAVFGAVDQVVEAGHDPRRFAADLLDRFRDLLVLDAVPGAGVSGLLDVPGDVLDRMGDQVRRLGRASVTRYAEITHQALVDMRGTTSPRLVLELVCSRMLLPDAAADAAAVLQRLEALERRASLTGPPSDAEPARPGGTSAGPRPAGGPAAATPLAPASAPPPAPARPAAPPRRATGADRDALAEPVSVTAGSVGPDPSPPRPVEPSDPVAPDLPTPAAGAAPAAGVGDVDASPPPGQAPVAAAVGGLDTTRVRQLWRDSVVAGITSKRTKALLHDAQLVSVTGTTIRLALPSPPLARMLGEASNVAAIQDALQRSLGGEWTVEVGVGGAAGAVDLDGEAASGGGGGGGLSGAGGAGGGGGARVPPTGSGPASSWSGDPGPGGRGSDAASSAAAGPVSAPASRSAVDTDAADASMPAPRRVAPGAPPEQREPPEAREPPEPPEPLDPRDDSDDPDPFDARPRAAVDPEELAVGLLRRELGARPTD